MFETSSIIFYFAVFLAKMVEVSIATLRVVLINRGQKILGSLIGFVESLIWVFVVSTVLKDITGDYMKVFVYCVAFSCGNFIGVTLEEKLALGMSVIEIISIDDKAELLIAKLRASGFGVTTIDSQGKDNKVTIIKTYMKRKQTNEVKRIITEMSPNSIFTVSDIKTITGGYIKK